MTELSMEVRAEAALVVDRTVALCRIPAPPLDEAERADVVSRWWTGDGLREVSIDLVGNVWARIRDGQGPGIVVAAHLDTVFGREIAHGVTHRDGRLVGPGVGDDTVAVAALSTLDRLLPAGVSSPVWIVATVGEEGLGNLKGVTGALELAGSDVGALIALEGNYLGRVNVIGVGSHRLRIVLTGDGGHAWEDAANPSAVHAAAAMIVAFDAMARPEGRTSLNVGTITGGESINARAQHAELVLDLRAEDQSSLDAMVAAAEEIIDTTASNHGVKVDVEVIGRRPAGSIDAEHRLVRAARKALTGVGWESRLTSASTDANAAYARGIPAVTLGITTGDLTHTENEWIDLDPIGHGLLALAETITHYTATEEL